ncbi:unnamed protein product [Chrysoparadoxa australica]
MVNHFTNPEALEALSSKEPADIKRLLNEMGGKEKVPLLSKELLQAGYQGLVRYRGMVQDVLQNEMYIGTYETVDATTGVTCCKSGRYHDVIPTDANVDSSSLMERYVLHCIPVPGLLPWAQSQNSGQEGSAVGQQQDESESPKDESESPELLSRERKRWLDMDAEAAATAASASKKGRSANHEIAVDVDVEVDIEASPTSGQGGAMCPPSLTCIVKIYDDECEYKVNDTVEFMGILGSAHEIACDDIEGDVDMPPPYAPPQLHCLSHSCYHAIPAVQDPNKTLEKLMHRQQPKRESFEVFMQHTRQQIVSHLACSVGGDEFAAEYVLLTLITQVVGRTAELLLGSFGLNLIGASPSEPDNIYRSISDLVPKLVHVPINLGALSDPYRFAPQKDYSKDRLMPSALQVSKGTVLLCDETKMTAGSANDTAVNNLRALRSMVQSQKLPYNFGYYSLDFETDSPIIVVSKGRSIVKEGVALPLERARTTAIRRSSAPVNEAVRAETLSTWRSYIAAVRQLTPTLQVETAAVAERDYVAMRQQQQPQPQPQKGVDIGADELHLWITLSRLHASSLGCAQVTPEHWQHISDMERRRRERLAEELKEVPVLQDQGAPASGSALPLLTKGMDIA